MQDIYFKASIAFKLKINLVQFSRLLIASILITFIDKKIGKTNASFLKFFSQTLIGKVPYLPKFRILDLAWILNKFFFLSSCIDFSNRVPNPF